MRDYALVLSNDIIDSDRMLEVTRQAAPYLDGVKIGVTSSMRPGIGIIDDVKKIMGNGVVLADYKVPDIGFMDSQGDWNGTNEKIVRGLASVGADYITCHSIVGLSSIEESVATAHKYGSKVLTLPYMTHKGANLFFGMPLGPEQKKHIKREFEAYGLSRGRDLALWGVLDYVQTSSDLILALGERFGVDGFIGPANNPEILRRYREFTNREIWSPGFGRQDKSGRDLKTQIREWALNVGPQSAMIVGSLIYKADDPAVAAREVMEIRDKVVGEL